MSKYDTTFDWVDFAQGRARFCGIQRGWDERGRVTFAVELSDVVRYGEIDQVFLENGNDYNIEVPSFGYKAIEEVGLKSAQGVLGARDLQVSQSLIIQLVEAGLGFEDPPNILAQSEVSHFMGKVFFREGWALSVESGESEVSP